MTALKLDSNNNLVYGYTFFEVEAKEKVLQDIKNALSLKIGENPFNNEEGFDFLGYLQKDRSNYLHLKNKIISTCKKIENVKDVILEVDNNLNIQNFVIKTTYEDIKIE